MSGMSGSFQDGFQTVLQWKPSLTSSSANPFLRPRQALAACRASSSMQLQPEPADFAEGDAVNHAPSPSDPYFQISG